MKKYKDNKHGSRIPVHGKRNPPMPIERFREKYRGYGYELVDITQLCKFSLGVSGWCNDFNEPDEQIYHIKCKYRDEEVCSFPNPERNLDEKYAVFVTNQEDITGADFTIFRKVKIE